ncbi:MAG: HNH endonuclease signature motif containing protein [Rhodococcus sp. (in: high G+C Gram-positive bacteria)]
MEPALTQQRLQELLLYDTALGIFIWRVYRGPMAPAGKVAGSTCSGGHRQIAVDGKRYMLHRLAWLYVHGKWPEEDIDHRDRDKLNNVPSNLRDLSRSQNVQNRKEANSNNTTGRLGVGPCNGGFRARIAVDGELRHLGVFETIDAADEVYQNAKLRLHPGYVP